MYELLTGKLPFRGDNAVEIALKHLKEPMPSIRDELPDIPQSVENIILRATAKNPKNRYSDAREMHEDLKTCLDESRANELKITFKYPENDYDDTKLIKTVKEQKPKVNKNEGEPNYSKYNLNLYHKDVNCPEYRVSTHENITPSFLFTKQQAASVKAVLKEGNTYITLEGFYPCPICNP